MTAGEYKSEIFPFLAAIAIQLAISYLNEQDLIRRGCFVNGELDYSRSDCVAQGWGVEAAMMIGPGGIPLAGLKAVAKKGPIVIGKEALKKDWPQYIGNGLERMRFWADDALYEMRAQVYRATARVFRYELKGMFTNLLQRIPRNVLKPQGNILKIGERTITREAEFSNINRLPEAASRLKELNDRGLIEGVQKAIRGTAQKAYVTGVTPEFLYDGARYRLRREGYDGSVVVEWFNPERGVWEFKNQFDHIMLLKQNTDEGLKYSLVRGESTTELTYNKAGELVRKEESLRAIKKYFSGIGMEIEETINVAIHSQGKEVDDIGRAMLEVQDWKIIDRGIDELGPNGAFMRALNTLGFG